MASGTRKKQRIIIESDDESNSADTRDQDWTPDDEYDENHRNCSNGIDTSLPEEIEFDSTAGFKLKIIKKMKQSNHLVWIHFGYLMKDDKIVKKVEKKIYCVKCFDEKKFKRLVTYMWCSECK